MEANTIEGAIERIKSALAAEGYDRCPFCRDELIAFLYRKDRHNEVYLGTYLNEFSLVKCCGEEDEPPLWSDLIGHSAVVISIEPVYRHNGTAKNASVAVVAHYWDAKPHKWYPPETFYKDNYKAIVKAESPTDYCANGWQWTTNACVKCERIVKVRADELTERKLANIVAKVKGIVDEWKCPDYSKFAEDRAKWHKDTSAEHAAWVSERRNSAKRRTA